MGRDPRYSECSFPNIECGTFLSALESADRGPRRGGATRAVVTGPRLHFGEGKRRDASSATARNCDWLLDHNYTVLVLLETCLCNAYTISLMMR